MTIKMSEEQLATIVALMTGMQLSIVHLSNVLCAQTSLSKDALATSFEETAQAVPSGVAHREVVQTSVLQVARLIRGAASGREWNDLMSRLQP